MKNLVNIFAIALVTVLFSSCSIVGGIFKAGMGVGIFIVVVVIAIIVAIIAKASK